MTFEVLRFKPHARERMRQRRISYDQVRRTVNDPHRLSESRGRWVAERDTAHGNILRVVYTVEPDGAALIITVIRISP